MKNKILNTVLISILLLVVVFFVSTNFIINVQWFKEVGYLNVFFTKLIAICKLFVPIFILYFCVIAIYLFTLRKSIRSLVGDTKFKSVKKYFLLSNLVISILGAGATATTQWYKILQFTNAVPFGEVDPIFNKDISFYVFKLPLVQSLFSTAISLIIILVLITVIIYLALGFKDKIYQNKDNVININSKTYGIRKFAGKQLAVLASVLSLLIGCSYLLKSYNLVYSTRGVSYGAGYTDVKITMIFYKVIAIACVISSIVVFISILKLKFRPIIISIASIAVLIVLEPVVAIFTQQFVVKPNEMELEKPYISYSIDATKKAFNIDEIEVKEMEPNENITSEKLEDNKDIIENLKVNSTGPLLSFYQQVQLIKNYYEFNDADTDRYNINGKYTQVFVSPREINREAMTTWQNKHLRYTHGYGLAMSRVNSVTEFGQPDFVMKDIPTVNTTDINLENPRIYFGESDNDYVIVNTEGGEFDYPTGDTENTFNYNGTGGLKMTPFNRVLFSIYERNPKILMSSSITSESRIILNRNIVKRVQEIAPFLTYDSDPYIVVHDGRLVWMMNAYTSTDKYPFSEPHEGVNYIRNSVKVVVDAFNGNVDFYVTDENDPIINCYLKIYKGLFKPLSEMPEDLKEHFRYPQDLFELQSKVLTKYHVDDPIKLFTEEDLWDRSLDVVKHGGENLSQGDEGKEESILNKAKENKNNEAENEGLYLMTKLPDEENVEMMLLDYFNMRGKQSMVALLGARMDGDNYGELVMYKFPPQRTIYSPILFKNRIQQDPNISKEISLWAGKGSEVIYGDIIIVPIEDSLLYLNTIYLKANSENSMPEMKRVILSNGDKIVIEENIEKALLKLFNYNSFEENKNSNKDETSNTEITSDNSGVKEAADLFNKAIEAQKNGDWATYGEFINKLGDVLNKMSHD
ncbi:UPF0182 family protein [Clostridium perfringens]|uniref:UPF0182 protein CPR_0011 n=1 Tax=Clostridium perfringens (strain SM101 / Type A) TaxID=289380 RepID=Y011_CLOPS|nr:UPF0182 family protein [Clostridium perfringens]Q0SWX2.1 RecName: Full=UPF0182 protein CPR_0011 [Clostridium perfringens SM101]ABG86032.1 putative membrane protein [Clostridium perfringens SM101]EJT5917954.1 UPF0182 family protein [Clostridium perfringens]EJT5925570.1 UPF0182 family protein [Clostridium perfringens]EJT6136664.1 UPF0182 family protein [Clostridium perfringens]EJT6150939.1 UPF0182 family protein [Clostridium perfringens]